MATIREKILKQLDGIKSLPMLSDTVLKLLAVLRGNCETVNASHIASVIERDMAMSAKVLSVANSVQYSGRYGAIADIGQAVARLGISEITRICLIVNSMQLFPHVSHLLDIKEFWRHSIAAGLAVRTLSEHAGEIDTGDDSGYVAGMFHDIGSLVLDSYFHKVYETVRQHGSQKGINVAIAERELLGIDHGEIGAVILGRWGLPDRTCAAVHFHHNPDACEPQYRPVAQLVHVSDFVCAAMGAPEPGELLPQQSSYGAWHDLKLDQQNLMELAREIESGISIGDIFVSVVL